MLTPRIYFKNFRVKKNSKVIKKEESNNNAIIGITKLIPRVSKIEVVTNKNTNK